MSWRWAFKAQRSTSDPSALADHGKKEAAARVKPLLMNDLLCMSHFYVNRPRIQSSPAMTGPHKKGPVSAVLHGGLESNGQTARQNSPDRPMTEAVVANLPMVNIILPMVNVIAV